MCMGLLMYLCVPPTCLVLAQEDALELELWILRAAMCVLGIKARSPPEEQQVLSTTAALSAAQTSIVLTVTYSVCCVCTHERVCMCVRACGDPTKTESLP